MSHLSLGTCVGVQAAPVLRSLTSTTAVPLLRETSQLVCIGQQLTLLCENRLIHTSTLLCMTLDLYSQAYYAHST